MKKQKAYLVIHLQRLVSSSRYRLFPFVRDASRFISHDLLLGETQIVKELR